MCPGSGQKNPEVKSGTNGGQDEEGAVAVRRTLTKRDVWRQS
jgi:hypothetical protein